ncbi:MAG: carboxypeptidase-like regulatory domain-containing protein [Thermoplasmata archaeon]|nr:carboxypeptidase-like regulatory domain-containing protein [Thermoplasmata archaeon]
MVRSTARQLRPGWRTVLPGFTLSLLTLLAFVPSAGAIAPHGASSVVLAIDQSSRVTEQGTFTVSLKLASTANIQVVFFTFCQLTSPVCYTPVPMSLHANNWYVGTTNPMSTYLGMTIGVHAGYNISILYTNMTVLYEPQASNPFTNLTVATSVIGEFMFEMSVQDQVYGLSGHVLDAASGTGLLGAKLTLAPGNLTTMTNSSTGSYAFAGIGNGTYHLNVSEHGYKPMSASVTIAGHDAVQDVRIASNPSPVNPWAVLTSPRYGGVPLVVVPVVATIGALAAFLWVRRGKGSGSVPPAPFPATQDP